jgi:chlorobactene glucosyltransferase
VKKFSQVTLVTGKPLPAGWLGKNWACRQLADRAAGDVLIFTDADTWHEPDAVSRTLDWMTAKNLDMFSAFPRQIMGSFAERLTIPFIDLILFSLLPLWLTYYGRSEKFAAANGQWIAFRRKSYAQMGGHNAVRDKVVEDVELARLVKRSGGRILTTSGKDAVYCRMYENFNEIRSGFEKNLFGLTGNQPVLFLLLIVLFAVGYIVPLVLVFIPQTSLPAGLTLLMQVLIRFSLALTLKHDLLVNVLLAPITVLIGMYIGISSFYKSKKGKIVWKGRQINSKPGARN